MVAIERVSAAPFNPLEAHSRATLVAERIVGERIDE